MKRSTVVEVAQALRADPTLRAMVVVRRGEGVGVFEALAKELAREATQVKPTSWSLVVAGAPLRVDPSLTVVEVGGDLTCNRVDRVWVERGLISERRGGATAWWRAMVLGRVCRGGEVVEVVEEGDGVRVAAEKMALALLAYRGPIMGPGAGEVVEAHRRLCVALFGDDAPPRGDEGQASEAQAGRPA